MSYRRPDYGFHPSCGYQVKYAETIRASSGLPVIAVGLIDSLNCAKHLEDERADFVALGEPYATRNGCVRQQLNGKT